ncbi:TPA: hypothetical protein ACH3X2_009962 [Trebouxia sp. C0005]
MKACLQAMQQNTHRKRESELSYFLISCSLCRHHCSGMDQGAHPKTIGGSFAKAADSKGCDTSASHNLELSSVQDGPSKRLRMTMEQAMRATVLRNRLVYGKLSKLVCKSIMNRLHDVTG